MNNKPRKTWITRKVFLSMVYLSVYSVCSVVTSGPSLVGRWDLSVKGDSMKYAAWLEVGESGGTNTVRYVGRVASVRNIRHFEIQDRTVSFSENEFFSPYEKCTHRFAFDGDRVTGTITRTNGTVLAVTGQRAPALDRSAPAKWSEPRPLFTGRDFAGWQAIYGSVPPSNWRAEHGELITFNSGTPLRTTELYEDFKLHVEFNCPTNANSGIYLRGRYEVQIEDDSIKAPPNQQTGGIYGWLGPDTAQPRRAGQWRSLDITLIGRRATVVLDGVTLFTNREIPGITGEARDSDEAAPGPIILQASHARDGGELRFRNLSIATPDASAEPIRITDAEYEGRPQFRIVTPSATWLMDRGAGGFSRLIDREGSDWISFHKDPLNKFPESAGAGYRGIPNMVFGKDKPEAGAGHPGFDQCETTLVASNVTRTVSKSGRWAWTWSFVGDTARLRMELAPTNTTWWFLYEGPVGGRWSPATHYWGTDKGGPNRERPDSQHQHFDQWRWTYFGDDSSPRVLFIAQREPDELPDTLWYLGAENNGAITATDGMIVFGLGRGPNGSSHFRGAGQEFILGFVDNPVPDTAGHRRIATAIQQFLSKTP